MSNTQRNRVKNEEIIKIEEFGDEHICTSHNTPMREDAFDLTDEQKMKKIEKHFREIMNTLGLDLTDDSLKGTPHRVAKMFVKEIYSGLDPKNKPKVTLFENKYHYKEMLVERDIAFHSNCEHHFVPIYGKTHVGYIPNGKVVGLSKINRLVQYYAKRPQVQERLNVQIAQELKNILDTDSVAVVIEAEHMCVSSRGVNDTHSSTVTAHYLGEFKTNPDLKKEFLSYIKSPKKL